MFKDLGATIRRMSVERTINDIKKYTALTKTKKEKFIAFLDESFATEESWLEEFTLRYRKEISLPFHVEFNPIMVKPNILKKLANAGLHTLLIGIQSGSDEIRNYIFQRPGKSKDIISLAKQINNFGIKASYDFI